eukprot:TRINITY_DN3668_c0_g1_i1.p1 TRINITY_DN3668_c0_g1~~TRINITY_DN3668_c0_g1_i1.p1  ORF type:complete len:133 (-),score=14.52 TRINITY_DN3668_c0_g1_i1:153-551(-)
MSELDDGQLILLCVFQYSSLHKPWPFYSQFLPTESTRELWSANKRIVRAIDEGIRHRGVKDDSVSFGIVHELAELNRKLEGKCWQTDLPILPHSSLHSLTSQPFHLILDRPQQLPLIILNHIHIFLVQENRE